jgi:hypothetical protein
MRQCAIALDPQEAKHLKTALPKTNVPRGTNDGSLAGQAASGRKSQCRRILGGDGGHFKRLRPPERSCRILENASMRVELAPCFL